MNKTLLKKLLEKYSRGACSPGEIKIIESWLSTIENNKLNSGRINEDQELALVKLNVNKYLNAKGQKSQPKLSFLYVAASLVALAGCLGWFFLKPKPVVIAYKRPQTERYIKNGFVIIKTPKGIRQNVNLPDGSRITMDAATSLRYPVRFKNHVRPVYLEEGQALFNVAKDRESPFTVYTRKFATTALGTAFNIRNYAVENKISISLIHGKIRIDDLRALKKKTAPQILFPHQQLVLYRPSGTVTQSAFKDTAPVLSWTTGILYFKDAGASEVFNTIDNSFNVQIINKSSHLNWSYTGVFQNQSLSDVLKTICLTEGITYTINKQTITLN